MEQYFELLQQFLQRYGVLIVFPILLLENFPLIGFVTPAITILIFVGFMLAATPSILLETAAVAYAAILLGDNIWFFIGRYSGGKWKALKTVNSRAKTVLEVLSEQSRWLMLLYQFPPYFRMFLPFGLGMSRFPFSTWVFINLIGSFLYVTTFVCTGYVAYSLFDSIEFANDIGRGITFVITTFSIIYLLVLVVRYIKKRQTPNESNMD